MVNNYMKALVLTLVVFTIGIFTGFFMEGFMTSDMSGQATDIEMSVQELEIEMLYLQNLNKTESCPIMNDIIQKTNIAVYDLSNELTQYSEKNILFEGDKVLDIKKKYTLLLIKNMILQERLKEECGLDAPIVLYFYEREGCNDCIIQGNILTYFNEKLEENIVLFPLDKEIESSMLSLLVNKYGIDTVPSLVIDGVTHKGLVSKEDLKEIICESLDNETCSVL